MARLLTQHNRMSFDDFIKRDVERIICDSRNIVRVLKNEENNEYKTRIFFYFGGKDGKGIKYKSPKVDPMDCRLDGLTYEGILELTLDIDINHDNTVKTLTQVFELATIPTMLHSTFCKLKNKTDEELCSLGESPHERGGYFIIKGLEKVILSQEDQATNIVYTRVENSTGNLIMKN